MTTPAIIIGIVYVLALTTSIVPWAVGLEPKGESTPSRQVLVALVFAATQALMALLGHLLGMMVGYLFGDLLKYVTFGMMVIVAVKMIVDSMKVLKGKRLYSFTSNWGYLLLGILAGMNTLLMSVCSQGYMPIGNGYFLAIAGAAFLWAWPSVRKLYTPKMLRTTSFIEFSGAVFLIVIAILYLFTDLI
ncbi:MAG: manganese efflux pump MntP family protein [Bacteroidales bacterium]|nr:manganese efflux pump MntP family protein [Bacteroidales bacterium]